MKRYIALLISTVFLAVTITQATEKVEISQNYTGIYCLNNQYNNVDYKITENQLETIRPYLPADSILEDFYQDGSMNLSDLSVEESWLVSNNILHRPYNFDGSNCNIISPSSITKTQLYTMLYKSYNGVIDSRLVLLNGASVRNGAVVTTVPAYAETEDTITNANFPYGDYYYVKSANVYELYLKELLDMGYISVNEFNSSNGAMFLNEYNALSSGDTEVVVPWDRNLGVATGDFANALGYSNSYQFGENITVTEGSPNYFISEELITIDALGIIADYVRHSEKDMSELEASIVAYKYGVNYLNYVSAEEKADIEFLVAKGIIDFEDSSEFTNLYDNFSYEYAIELMYRVANPDARVNFSAITLTDGESFWMEKGYMEDNFSITMTSNLPIVETISEEYWQSLLSNTVSINSTGGSGSEDNTEPNNFIDDIIGLNVLDAVEANADEGTSYTVIKMFDNSHDYYYKNIPISDLEAKKGEIPEFVSYETANLTATDGSSTQLRKITFSVKAKDYDTAVIIIDNNISVDGSLEDSSVRGYTTISEETGEEITLISATTLRSNFLDISIIEDKVLMNNVTGTTAVILPEEGYALVGNRIIRSRDLMIIDTANETYYNLDIICTLLRNTQLSTLTDKKLYVCKEISSETIVNVKSNLGSELCKTYITDITGLNSPDGVTNITCYNIDNLQEGVNSISRKFTVNVNGEDHDVYVIVDWEYVVPGDDVVPVDKTTVAKNLTMNDVNSVFYTKPEDENLRVWWDSNISVSNSLANFMYGTVGVEYVKSGYLVPNLTILKDPVISDVTINSIFTSNGFTLDATGLEYCDSTTNWWESYYSASKISNEYVKALALSARGYKFLDALSMSSGKQYGTDYYVTQAGVIYRNVDSHELVEYDASNKELIINTRTQNVEYTITENTKFIYNNHEWVYTGVYPGDEEGEIYYVVQPCFIMDDFKAMSFRNTEKFGIMPKFTGKAQSGTDDSLKEEAHDRLLAAYDLYFPDMRPFYNYGVSKNMFGANPFCIKEYFSNIYDNEDAYYVNDKTLINANGKTVQLSIGDYESYQNNDIYCIPKFYVSAQEYKFIKGANDTVVLTSKDPLDALSYNNVLTSNLASSVTDSIINKYTKTVPVNALIAQQKILIGDITFIRSYNDNGELVFCSEPIKSLQLVNALKFCKPEEELGLIKSNLFIGQRVEYVNYGGYNYYLSNFIIDASVGPLTNPADNLGILYRKNGSKQVYMNDSNSAITLETSNPTAVCITLKFDEGLLARPTNEKQNTYVLLNVCNVSANTAIDDIPFYRESLSYAEDSSSYVSVTESKFKPSELYTRAKNNYQVMMTQAFAGDLKTIIWMFAFYFSTYLAIMVWIAYIVLTKGFGFPIFNALTIPRNNGKFMRNGFDLIKIGTLGIYNIDSEPTLARTVVSSFVCFFISYAIVFWQPF